MPHERPLPVPPDEQPEPEKPKEKKKVEPAKKENPVKNLVLDKLNKHKERA